jgi:hypothetical protein
MTTTSRQAWEKQTPEIQDKRRALILEALSRVGRTCDELEEVLGLSHQTCSSVVTGLRKDEKIIDSGERRPTRYDCDAIVWMLRKIPEGPDEEWADLVRRKEQTQASLLRARARLTGLLAKLSSLEEEWDSFLGSHDFNKRTYRWTRRNTDVGNHQG